MALVKLTLSPEQSSYKVTDGNDTVSAKLAGGLSKSRIDILNPARMVSCKWMLTPFEFEVMRAFYLSVAKGGANKFLIDLMLDDTSALTEVTAKFVPNKSTQSHRGFSYAHINTLEIEAPIVDHTTNYNLVTLYNNYGEGSQEFINSLDLLMNTTLPELAAF